MMTPEDLSQVMGSFGGEDAAFTVVLRDPHGNVTVNGRPARRPSVSEKEPYEGFSKEWDGATPVWIVMDDDSGMYSAWPINDAEIDTYGRMVLRGPRGSAIFTKSSS